SSWWPAQARRRPWRGSNRRTEGSTTGASSGTGCDPCGEDVFTYFAHRAMSRDALRDVSGGGEGRGHRPARGRADAGPGDGGGLDVVVAHVDEICRLEAPLCCDLLQ